MSTPCPAKLVSTPEARAALRGATPDPDRDLDAYIDHMTARDLLFASPAFRPSSDEIRANVLAAYERGYFKNSDDANCAKAGTVVVTVIAGPLNWLGVNPKINCDIPEPSR